MNNNFDRKAHQDSKFIPKIRWAVWIDDKSAVIVSSRRNAKNLCYQAKDRAYFCRAHLDHVDLIKLTTYRLTDFLIWYLCSDGMFSRSVWVRSPEIENGSLPCCNSLRTSYASHRYERALRNPAIWKVGSKRAQPSLDCYPVEIEEITWDSDSGMSCAGYEKIAEFSSIAESCSTWHQVIQDQGPYFGTIDDGHLKIWVVREE